MPWNTFSGVGGTQAVLTYEEEMGGACRSWFKEIALVLVRFNPVASNIVNANHCIMRPVAMHRVSRSDTV